MDEKRRSARTDIGVGIQYTGCSLAAAKSTSYCYKKRSIAAAPVATVPAARAILLATAPDCDTLLAALCCSRERPCVLALLRVGQTNGNTYPVATLVEYTRHLKTRVNPKLA